MHFLNFIRDKIPTLGGKKMGFFPPFFCSLCNLSLRVPSELVIYLGEWDDRGRQHEAQPEHSVLFNRVRHIHGSGSVAEDHERPGVCQGKPVRLHPPPTTRWRQRRRWQMWTHMSGVRRRGAPV